MSTYNELIGEIVLSPPYETSDAPGPVSPNNQWRFALNCTEAIWEIFRSSMETSSISDTIAKNISMVANLTFQADSDTNDLLFKTRIGKRDHLLKLHFGCEESHDPMFTLMLPHEH